MTRYDIPQWIQSFGFFAGNSTTIRVISRSTTSWLLVRTILCSTKCSKLFHYGHFYSNKKTG